MMRGGRSGPERPASAVDGPDRAHRGYSAGSGGVSSILFSYDRSRMDKGRFIRSAAGCGWCGKGSRGEREAESAACFDEPPPSFI